MALATRRGVTPDRASTLLFASLSPLPSVMGYTLHAGQALEEIPQRRGPLNLHGVKGWYDFYASQVSVDSEGYCDAKTVGMKHVAVRDDGRSSAFKPNPGASQTDNEPDEEWERWQRRFDRVDNEEGILVALQVSHARPRDATEKKERRFLPTPPARTRRIRTDPRGNRNR